MKNPVNALVQMVKMKSIQFIITASFTLVTVAVMLFVGVMLYSKFSETAEQNAFLHTQQMIDQVSFNLNSYLDSMKEIFELAAEKIRRSENVPDDKLTERLGTILETREDLVSVAVFSREGELIAAYPQAAMRKNTRLQEQSWFQAALRDPGHISFSLPHIQNLFQGEYKWVVSMSRGISVSQNGEREDAILLVDVNFKTIDDLCQRVELGKKGYVYIIDLAGNIVYHPQQQLIYVGLKNENRAIALKNSYGSYVDESDGERRLVTIKTLDDIGWKIVGVSYMDEIATTKKEISGFIFWLLVVVIAVVVFVLTYISAAISRPIRNLERSMQQVEKGDFTVNLAVRGSHEVEQLSRRFNHMVIRIRQLMDQIIREQEAKRKSELEVLQAQINPHFLYNTLNSVVRMVGIGKNEDVITTITALSKLFRISLSKGKNIITVQEELEHVRNYLVIQKMRYKNKFTYEITAQDEVLPCKTLKLLLQPIVENAIYHGIEPLADQGRITVSAERSDGDILFRVRDNGLGIPPHVLEQIGSGQIKSKDGSGVGIKNVHERIRLFFGEAYGLSIESDEETGTTVTIRIPMITEET
ncbi:MULTISPECIES: sensor histidine kinase [Brevibacillus]|jgi:two-component system, sensor histidine kinase YesM|uniref:cache domain-containing sensor histidine kinase n=1 Tax=Brevibacillus TaxID=55080 RepID=UPI00209C533B|nr:MULTISPECIES: sensor histidine kinase [Brevibacillus]MDT3417266.1 two-component system sensor histidine kinase YesM [Brevibacillus aydinogluensis]